MDVLQAPPSSLLPPGSTLLDKASEAKFSSSSDPTSMVCQVKLEVPICLNTTVTSAVLHFG